MAGTDNLTQTVVSKRKMASKTTGTNKTTKIHTLPQIQNIHMKENKKVFIQPPLGTSYVII